MSGLELQTTATGVADPALASAASSPAWGAGFIRTYDMVFSGATSSNRRGRRGMGPVAPRIIFQNRTCSMQKTWVGAADLGGAEDLGGADDLAARSSWP